MAGFVPWDSQTLEAWSDRYAEGEVIDLDGRRTHYVKKGQGPPVLLVHGFNLDLYTWTANIDALSERFTVFAVDLWGSGYSTRDPAEYGYPLFEEQVRSFLDRLGIERASLVGHSMGGGTSIVFALHHSDRVNKLVLVDSVGIPRRIPLRGQLFKLPFIPAILMGLNTNTVRKKNLLDYWIHRRRLLSDDTFEMLTRHQKIHGTTEALLTILRKDFFNTLEEEIRALSNVGIPILIVWGKEDKSVPLESGERMHEILTESRLEVIENAGHLANFDQSERFNELVIEFLRTNEA
jgi:pimeloyl-ACP methyl ester carboxylesterase